MINSVLSSEWIAQLAKYQKLVVGYSGGLDSSVLLHALHEVPQLQSKVYALHVHHGISPNADAWQRHCQALCESLGTPFKAIKVHVDASSNVEEQARQARFLAFRQELGSEDALLLGHHLDDQAETVLLQLFRGAGVDGLSAMSAQCTRDHYTLVRPLLSLSRKDLELYAREHHLSWIEDESNADTRYARNFLRQEVIPLLQSQWPQVQGSLARSAMHCQQAQSNLDDLAYQDCPQLLSTSVVLSLAPMMDLNVARITNVLRVWFKKNKVQPPSTAILNRLIHEVVFARADAAPQVGWGEYEVRRYQKALYLLHKPLKSIPGNQEWIDFPKPLQLLGLKAISEDGGFHVPENATVEVRFRKGGEELIWHGHTRPLKKLFQEWEVPTWLRSQIPLIYINDELAAVVGYAIADRFLSQSLENSWRVVHVIPGEDE